MEEPLESFAGAPGRSAPEAADSQPMDQATVECLLRLLVERVEESERRYGEALNELHARLDHLSQTTEAARDTSAPEDLETFNRLHSQVSSLAKRLEDDSATPLDDFERLGKALTGGLRADRDDSAQRPGAEQPRPSPFAQSVMAARAHPRTEPEPAPRYGVFEEACAAPAPKQNVPVSDFDNRLAEMANRLEQSIGAAMPSHTVEALTSRIEEIGHQIAQTLERAPSRSALKHVEQQISEMGQQLTRAEEQLRKLGSVEERLLAMISRLEEKDTAPQPADLDAEQLQEIAAKAAVEAARLVADDSRKTTDRLEAMQRELNEVSTTSRQADNRLASNLQAVHESLKQLVQQVERRMPAQATQAPVAQADTKPVAAITGPAVQAAETSPASQPEAAKPAAPTMHASEKPAVQPAEPRMPAMLGPAAKLRPEAATQGQPKPARHHPEQKRPVRRSPDDAERRVKETLRERLGTAGPTYKSRDIKRAGMQYGFGGLHEEAVDLNEDFPEVAPEELVAAARRAAQAAAAHAEAREERASRRLAGSAPIEKQPGSRRRPLLIVSAAILLVISALLLYVRLGSKDAILGSTPGYMIPHPSDTTGSIGKTAPQKDGSETLPSAEDAGRAGSFLVLPDPDVSRDSG